MPISFHALRRFLERRPIVLVVHRSTGAHGSTSEPLDLELERIINQDTVLEIPTVTSHEVTTVEIAPHLLQPRYYPQEDLDKTLVRTPAISAIPAQEPEEDDPERTLLRIPVVKKPVDESFLLDQPVTLYERRVALFSDHVETASVPLANIVQETVPAHTIVTFRDRANRLTLEDLCRKAVIKHQRSAGLLPTHIIVNSMRLISERRADAWETYYFETQFGSVSMKLRGMKNCPYNVARAIVEDEERKVA